MRTERLLHSNKLVLYRWSYSGPQNNSPSYVLLVTINQQLVLRRKKIEKHHVLLIQSIIFFR